MIMLLVFWAVLIGSVIIVLRHGGQPERIGLAIMVVGSLLSALVVSEMPVRFSSVEPGIFAVDTIVLIALFLLAMTSKRFWPLWATSFHGAGMMTHLAASISTHSLTTAYALLQGFWAYPMFVTVLLGTWYHRQDSLSKTD